jgi:paraquat-inducible protein B
VSATSAAIPKVRAARAPSLIWIVPVIVALVGGWLIFKTLSEKGPVVTVAFRTADGIEAGKTKIRYKNIEIGLVESVRFSDDLSHVLLSAQMAKDAASFLSRGSRFWVVRPRLTLRGVSGLGTLVSGAYIEVEPGTGAPQRHFEGLESPPVVRSDVAGRRISLVSERLGSLGTGSPVLYRGIEVGEVLAHELGSDRKSVLVYAFVHAPFDQLVRSNTRFWNVSGVDVTLDSQGLNVQTESMQSVLFGGIAFETPASAEPLKANLEDVIFTLHKDKTSIAEQSFTQRLRFVLFFAGSVRGLNIGAPVEFKGIKVGSVVDVRLEFDQRDTTFRIPVVIEIEPERVIARDGADGEGPQQMLQTLVKRGLRARLQTGSLLTGQLFVELDMHPNTEIKLVGAGSPYPELPTIAASLEELTSSVKGVLANLANLDIKTINTEIIGTLQGARKLVNAPEITSSLTELETTLVTFRKMVSRVDRRVEPLAVNVDKTVSAGRKTLEKLQGTIGLFNRILRSNSPLQGSYIKLADELTQTARSVKSLVEMLERNPDSFIFGKRRR